ncbi:hypothetical protein [Paenibacillus sp. EKM205P]|uniref:hypothetical protein n=1 Tax=Paenibacillus sp. EKM205P TaxID=1683673 RepID=UPI0013EC9876|nr:hypothetical protein [Paenibacillus sp. EKM205P]KAF6591015.1 hypothetical protein G9G52_01160 [Paenibacillus sp. EKM205P]
MKIEAAEAAQQLSDILKGIKTEYEHLDREVRYYDLECTDLLHALEFMEIDNDMRLNISQQLQDNRRKRRVIKNERECLQPLYEVSEGHPHLVYEFERARWRAERIECIQKQRMYTPRIRTDMQQAFDKANRRNDIAGG